MKKIYVLLMLCLLMITCNKDVEPYNMKTEIKVSEIGATAAKVEVMSEEAGFDELDAVLEYSSNEDFSDLKQTEMKWDEDCFMAVASQLEVNTKYYYKVVFKGKYNSTETEVGSFTTLEGHLPTITTRDISLLTSNSAISGGYVTDDGGVAITARGVCWSTKQNPTINDNKTIDGNGTGNYISYITNLSENTQYYVRAYATNSMGTSYGSQMSFITLGEPQTFTVNGVSFTMMAVNGGTFQMGATSEQGSYANSDEKPVHSVTLSDYYIGETEVTQELWEAVMGSNPSNFSGYPQRPLENVSWNKCQTFITKLRELTGKNFRLPTEAEWEYAARGGDKSKGYKYSGSNTIENVAWYDGNSGWKTHDVKAKQANELGIYDMSGNVQEWCQDKYGSYSGDSQTNPTGPSSGSYNVIRGGNWRDGAGKCRVSRRDYSYPGTMYTEVGLRLCLSQ